MKIGVFDSGIGGLSVVQEMVKLNLPIEIHYIADHAHAPYGNKTDLEIQARAQALLNELQVRGCEMIVIACNTATAAAIEFLRQKSMIPIVGVEPYLNVIHQRAIFQNDCYGVLSTKFTADSQRFIKLKERLDPQNIIHNFASSNLAGLIEKAFAEKDLAPYKNVIKMELQDVVNKKITHLILGCTHYPLIANYLIEITTAEMISTGVFVAKRVENLLKNKTQISGDFYFKSTNNNIWEQKPLDWIHLSC
jgi:glutamate racemase